LSKLSSVEIKQSSMIIIIINNPQPWCRLPRFSHQSGCEAASCLVVVCLRTFSNVLEYIFDPQVGVCAIVTSEFFSNKRRVSESAAPPGARTRFLIRRVRLLLTNDRNFALNKRCLRSLFAAMGLVACEMEQRRQETTMEGRLRKTLVALFLPFGTV